MSLSTPKLRSPISWVPSLYFVQGMQFFVVMLLAGLMFKNMGVPNDQIARWTGLLGLAWAIKPLWSPFLELARSKKRVVVVTQFTGAAGLALMALAVQMPMYFAASIAVLFLIAYAAATHDIACDGLYLASLDSKSQAAYAGWQGAFFNASKFLTLGGLLVLAGHLEKGMGVFNAWSVIFAMLALLLAALAAYNARALPDVLNAKAGKVSAARNHAAKTIGATNPPPCLSAWRDASGSGSVRRPSRGSPQSGSVVVPNDRLAGLFPGFEVAAVDVDQPAV